jgi:Pyruvate/2-oxoacid:ferredoxin oxidoreductase delta subunit
MGHLGHLREEYEDLVDRLEGAQVSFPRPANPAAEAAWRELLEILFTPEEAALATKLPVRPASLKKIAALAGVTPEALRPRLDAMADKGLVFDLVHPETGKERWVLAPPVVGFLEFSLMRAHDMFPKERLARAMDTYMHGDDTFAREVFGGETVLGRALVNEDALGRSKDLVPEVLDWERASEVVGTARNIAVSLCYCRHKAEHLGRRCAAPMENCLTLNIGADFVVRRGFGRKIEAAEALDLLVEARENGLVQIADNVRSGATYVCNCCACCCGQLSAIQEFGFPAVNPSGFEPRTDGARCRGCAKCSKVCPIGAISLEQRREEARIKGRLVARVDVDRCIGCGLCALECRHDALTLAPRREPSYVPATLVERTVRMAIERGHVAHFIADQALGRGPRFLNLVLRTLAGLPAAQRALASEQVKSRFVRLALGTVRDPTGGGASSRPPVRP